MEIPKCVELERALLGVLIKRPEAILEISQIMGPSDFFRPEHQKLYNLLSIMHEAGDAISLLTVTSRIVANSDEYGGIAYVTDLLSDAPTTTNLSYYAKNVRDAAQKRAFLTLANDITRKVHECGDDLADLHEVATRGLYAIGEDRNTRGWKQISLIIDDQLEKIEELSKQDGALRGITTGFYDLDTKLAGLNATDLIILAARPAMGKTALALNIAQNAAVIGEVPVGIFSLEMSRGQLVTRLLTSEAKVDANHVREGKLSAEEWERLEEASDVLRRAPIYIVDVPAMSIGEVRARARRLATEHGPLGLIVVDYLQLMQADDPRTNREQQISAISRGLKALAKELEVPVVALSQLNRGVESRPNKRPMLSDLRESGAIEQDADVICFIYRDDYYNDDSVDKGLAELIIAKQRNGPTGLVKLVFQGQYTRFDSYADDTGGWE